MRTPEVIAHRDARSLAAAAAARLITSVVEAQAARGSASVVVTGGGIGTAVLAAVRDSAARDSIDWRELDVWWGDERFLAQGDPQRNETAARAALLDHVPIPDGRIHAIPGPDIADSAERSAEMYAEALAAAAAPEDHGPIPRIDVLILGVGPDAHVASLFPGAPALYDDRVCVAVHGSPKPPPTRVTLTLRSITAAQEVWLIASGQEKARAVRLLLMPGAGELQVPASAARGQRRTLVMLDDAAAGDIPQGLARPATA